MKSAYPSSQSFFDATSDSIRPEDVDKCRGNSSFSSLADLFSSPPSKSDLFPNVRSPIFFIEEVRFPTKKKRECEERTSIWHEWGSGECQTENVAQESSGLLSDSLRPSDSKSSELFSLGRYSESFPNWGCAITALVPEEFAFPGRKKREGSSWREERASWQDWGMSGSTSNIALTEVRHSVGFLADLQSSRPASKRSNLFSSSRSSLFPNLGSALGSLEELPFPARKKREERSFWQQCYHDGDTSGKIEKTEGCKPDVSSLADLYLKKSVSRCSSLFSKGIVSSSDEVIFPKRKNRCDRNTWRDWSNTGYRERRDDTDQENFETGVAAGTVYSSSEQSEVPAISDLAASSSGRDLAGLYENHAMENVRRSRAFIFISTACDAKGGTSTGNLCASSIQGQFYGPGHGLIGSEDASESGLIDGVEAEIRRLPASPTSDEEGNGQPSATTTEDLDGVDHYFHTLSRSRALRREHFDQRSSGQSVKFPPPLGSLSTHVSSRVTHHMPWVQLQPIRSEGRFILREVKVNQPVIFEPIRKGGRLVLHLIRHDNSAPDVSGKIGFRGYGTTSLECGQEGTELDLTPESPRVGMKRPDELKLARTDVARRLWQSASKGIEKTKELGILSSHVRPGIFRMPEVVGSVVSRKPLKLPKIWPEFESLLKLEASNDDLRIGTEIFESPRQFVEFSKQTQNGQTFVVYRGIDHQAGEVLCFSRGISRGGSWFLMNCSEHRHSEWRTLLRFDVETRERFSSFRAVKRADGCRQERNVPLEKRIVVGPRHSHLESFHRARRLFSSVPGLMCAEAESVPGVTGDRAITNPSPSEFRGLTVASRKSKMEVVSELWKGSSPPERALFPTCPRPLALGSRDNSWGSSTAYSFLQPSRTRADVSAEPNARLSGCNLLLVAGSFSCADGVENRHRQKSFWGHLPYVS